MGILSRLWRALRQLFHQTTGALCFCLAAFGGLTAWQEWRNPAAQWVAWLGLGYAAMMLVFGLASFRDARRVR